MAIPAMMVLMYGSQIGESACLMNRRKASLFLRMPNNKGVIILVLKHFYATYFMKANIGSS